MYVCMYVCMHAYSYRPTCSFACAKQLMIIVASNETGLDRVTKLFKIHELHINFKILELHIKTRRTAAPGSHDQAFSTALNFTDRVILCIAKNGGDL
jgi:hypothetical protein